MASAPLSLTGGGVVLRAALALLVGAVGAALAVAIAMPLPLLLGPLIANIAAALLGLPVGIPLAVRMAFVTIMGAFLASGFRPDMIDHVRHWPLSLLALALLVPLSTGLVGLYYCRVAKMSPVTAAFAALPGGLTTAILLGAAAGGNERQIIAGQSLRILFAVFAVSFLMWHGLDMARPPTNPFALKAAINWRDMAIIAPATVLGFWVAQRLRIPGSQILGPIAAVAPFYLSGTVSAEVPTPLLSLTLWVVGSAFGSQFAGFDVRVLMRLALHVAVAVTMLLGLAALLAWLLAANLPPEVGLSFYSVLLAFAPGGVAEMSIIALALNMDPGFVAVHHLARIILCVALAPIMGRWLSRRENRQTDDHGQ